MKNFLQARGTRLEKRIRARSRIHSYENMASIKASEFDSGENVKLKSLQKRAESHSMTYASLDD